MNFFSIVDVDTYMKEKLLKIFYLKINIKIK